MELSPVVLVAAGAFLVLVVVAVVILRRGRRGEGEVRAPSRMPVSSHSLGGTLRAQVWSRRLDDTTWERLEEVLISADVGAAAAARIVGRARSRGSATMDEAREMVAAAVLAEFDDVDRGLDVQGSPAVILVVGVNGSGKTTTIAKLAHMLETDGHTVTLAAADTFRAAAVEQLTVWGRRLGVRVVAGQEGADPASVAHDAITSARARGSDVVIVDTAGRLHSKRNLMEELSKLHRVANTASRVGEVLLVLDASGGQNGLNQVREFAAAVPVTGVALTKLDGTARGGVLVAVESELGVPVKIVGTGEGLDDLEVFDPARFVADLTAER